MVKVWDVSGVLEANYGDNSAATKAPPKEAPAKANRGGRTKEQQQVAWMNNNLGSASSDASSGGSVGHGGSVGLDLVDSFPSNAVATANASANAIANAKSVESVASMASFGSMGGSMGSVGSMGSGGGVGGGSAMMVADAERTGGTAGPFTAAPFTAGPFAGPFAGIASGGAESAGSGGNGGNGGGGRAKRGTEVQR